MPSARMKEAWWVFMSESKQEQEAIASEALRVNQLFAELEVAEQHSLQELQQAQQDRDEQVARVKALEAEVVNRMAQLDAFASEKDSAIQTADDLKQQLAAQLETLQQAHSVKDQQAVQLKRLQDDLAQSKAQLDAFASEKDSAIQTATEAQGEAELTLLHLHQVQEELQHYVLHSRAGDELSHAQAQQLAAQLETLQQAHSVKDQQAVQLKRLQDDLAQSKAQLDAFASEKDSAIQTADDLKQQLAAQLRSKDQALQAASASNSDLSNQLQERSQELETANKKLTEAQGEAELTLLRLNQVQEELEKYFLRSRAGDELSQAQALENARAMGLLGRMIRLQAPGL